MPSESSHAIRGTALKRFREDLAQIPLGVTDLQLWYGPIQSLPRRLSKLSRMTSLDLFSLRELRAVSGRLPSALEQFGIFGLDNLRQITSDLRQIKFLTLADCGQLQELSGQLDKLEHLEVIDCPMLQLLELPAGLTELVHVGGTGQTLGYRLPDLKKLFLRRWPQLNFVACPDSLKLLDLRGSELVHWITYRGWRIELDRSASGQDQITFEPPTGAFGFRDPIASEPPLVVLLRDRPRHGDCPGSDSK